MAVGEAVDRRGGAGVQPVGFVRVELMTLRVEGGEMQPVALVPLNGRGVEREGGLRIGRRAPGGRQDRGREHALARDARAVFPFDIPLCGKGLVFVGIGVEGTHVGEGNGRDVPDEDVALDHEGPFAVMAEFNLEGVDAGGGAQQRGGKRRDTGDIFRCHQNFRVRLTYGMG